MSFRTRFIVLALFNSLLLIVGLWLAVKSGIDLSQRLIDLNLNSATGVKILIVFLAGVVSSALGNFLLLSSRKSEFTYDQVISVLRASGRPSARTHA